LFLRLNEVTLFAMLPEVLVNYRTDPAVLRYELWQRLSRYSRYAVHCRDRFRQQLPPMAMAPWTRTLTAIAQIHLIDNIRFVKHHIKHRLILR
jgi:hypothetical protein